MFWDVQELQTDDAIRLTYISPDGDEGYPGTLKTVVTDQPGLQFYTGDFLDGSIKGKGGWKYPQYSGLCLETQHFPDSPHHQHFLIRILLPGQIFTSATIHKITIRQK